MSFEDFLQAPPGAPPKGDPPPSAVALDPANQAISDRNERRPGVQLELDKEIARQKDHPELLAILTDPKQNGMDLVNGPGGAPTSTVPPTSPDAFSGFAKYGAVPKAIRKDALPVSFDTFAKPSAIPKAKNADGKDTPFSLPKADAAMKDVILSTPMIFGLKLGDAASLVDLVGSIPGQIAGVAMDFDTRIRGLSPGHSRRDVAKAAVSISGEVGEDLNPHAMQRLMALAGLGNDGDKPGSDLDAVMEKAGSLVAKGGEWVEQHTGGKLLKEDVQSIVNTAMAAAGGRSLASGLRAIVPRDMPLQGVKLSPEAMQRAAEARSQTMDPKRAADMHAEASEASTKAATEGKTKMTEGKTLVLDPITGELHEPIPKMGAGLPKPTTLDVAKEKMASGRAFDMSAEERIAYKGWMDEPGPTLVDEQGTPLTVTGKPIRFPRGQLGAIDMDAFKPGPASGRGMTLDELSKLAPSIALGSLLGRSDYTLKTLDRLPQGNIEFTKAHILQELKRQDVTDAERAAVQHSLDQVPGEKITAKDLLVGVKKATGDFELEAKATDEYADYGLEGVDRGEGLDYFDEDGHRDTERSPETHPQNATTTLYRLPAHMTLSTANHFGDPNLFGWTRSFEEDGVRHVVEIQSDLAQKNKASMTEEQRADAHHEIENSRQWAQTYKERMEDYSDKMRGDTEGAATMAYRRSLNDYQRETARIAEFQAKLEGAGKADAIAPIVKNWPKRLIREELAKAARGEPNGNDNIDMFAAQEAGDAAAMQKIRDRAASRAAKVLRFATAETVAKVEGWPDLHEGISERLRVLEERIDRFQNGTTGVERDYLEATKRDFAKTEAELQGPRFLPEHQSIFDRYKRDIEKFLKQLGGTPHIDSHGHTWLEVPVPKKGPTQMFGRADPTQLARLAAIGLGAWAAKHYSDDHDWWSALAGAIGVATLTDVPIGKAVKALVKAAKPDTRIKINGLANAQEETTRLAAIDIWAMQNKIEKLVPTTERRSAITHAMEAGPEAVAKLSPEEQQVAKLVQEYFDQKLWEGIDAGILKSARDNYVTHLWDWSKNDKGLLEQWIDKQSGQSMSPNSPFAKSRSIPTIAEGKAQGLTPLTEDISQIMGVYGNSMSRSIANAQFLATLKGELTPEGKGLVMSAEEAPPSYVSINHPQFMGSRVHPDIAPSIKMLFDTSSPGTAMKILQGLSDTAKRVAVSFSLFHAKALVDAMVGGSSNPFAAMGKLPGYVLGTNKYLQELKAGSASPLVQRAIKGGLMFSLERAGAGVEDAGRGFYGSMTYVQGVLDRAVPGAGLPIKGLIEFNHKVDTFMWARLHAGLKLNTFAEKYRQLLDNSAKAAEKGGKQALTPDEAGRIAASYANDLFGGLNWRRIAEDATTRWGRELGQTMLTPGSRRVLQLAAFAPDWTVSTTRAAVQAFGKPDMLAPKTLAGLHQQYLLRSALYYLVVGDSINYSMSGHHIWQNKDWTVLDMDPKGERHMQWSKHTMEPVHWLMKPGQQALNKMGVLPRETIEQAMKVEYLSAKGRMPPMKSRAKHLMANFAPIAIQQGQSGEGASAFSGFLGAPIYGQTEKQREAAREKQRREREATR